MISQPTPVASLVLTNQNGLVDRQMDTVSKLVKPKGLAFPQLSWQQKQFHV